MRTLPKGSGQLSCEIGMLAVWLPNFWEIMESVPTTIPKIKENDFTAPGLAEMSNGCIVLDKKMSPDTLEALDPSGVFKTLKKWRFGLRGSRGWGPPWPPYALRGIIRGPQ